MHDALQGQSLHIRWHLLCIYFKYPLQQYLSQFFHTIKVDILFRLITSKRLVNCLKLRWTGITYLLTLGLLLHLGCLNKFFQHVFYWNAHINIESATFQIQPVWCLIIIEYTIWCVYLCLVFLLLFFLIFIMYCGPPSKQNIRP